MKKSILTFSLIIAAGMVQAAPMNFEGTDTNKDGTLSMEEWMVAQKKANPKASEKNHAAWFKNNDKNKDGNVTMQEFKARKAAQAKAKEKAKAKAPAKGKKKDS